MTDLHTHILPGMDDGARDADESVLMLRQELAQGVDTVVLTPHFYRDRETPDEFLQRRAKSFKMLTSRIEELPAEERQAMPKLVLGAEVALDRGLLDCDQIVSLCIGQTKNLLLEMPFSQWNDQTIGLIYDLMGQTGVVPVIAHLERYLNIQKKGRIQDILELNVPVQVSADILLYPLLRWKILNMLRRGVVNFVASDCHDAVVRQPNLKAAMDVIRRKLGDLRAEEVLCFADSLAER